MPFDPRAAREHRFAPGETIFAEDDASDLAYVIRTGRVEILKATPKGPLLLAVLGAGDVVGEMGLLDERPRSATARALDAVVAHAVGPREFTEQLLHDPRGALGLLHGLFERLRTSNQKLTESATGRLREAGVPVVRLLPDADVPSTVLPPEGLAITRFPFRIGRVADADRPDVLHYNDLELPDRAPYTLSRNHFSLDLGPDGVVVRDRGSQRGTLVNRLRIGARFDRDVAPLEPGENRVVAGAPPLFVDRADSPFRFRVTIA